MALILRPEDNKILSISRKKIHCHEMMYAKFDSTLLIHTRPQIDFRDFTLNVDEIDRAIEEAKEDDLRKGERR